MKTEALEVLNNRRSIRRYKAEQITEEELQAVLKAGTYAPTACGDQSPLIVAVQDPETVARVDALNAQVIGTPGHPYYGAPTILLVFYTEAARSEELGILDGAAVTTNLLNAAYACGLGSCWINRCREMFELPEGKALLREWGLPENLRGVGSLSLGYADCEQPVPKARKADYIVRR